MRILWNAVLGNWERRSPLHHYVVVNKTSGGHKTAAAPAASSTGTRARTFMESSAAEPLAAPAELGSSRLQMTQKTEPENPTWTQDPPPIRALSALRPVRAWPCWAAG